MAPPTVSVVIPTYNRANYLPEALESVFSQTFKDYEVIVVDDGSTDGTRQILAKWVEAGRLRYEYQENAGVSAARNRGIKLAKGKYVAFLDSDDLFIPSKLEKQVALLGADSDLGMVHCNFSKFNERGEDLGVRDTTRYEGWIYPWMLQEWSVLLSTPSLLVRRDVLREIDGFDETMNWAEDVDLYRRVGRRYQVGVVPEVLNRVRVHSESSTAARLGAAKGYRYALDKAFAEDPTLGGLFRRRAYANMYTNLAQNLLGEGPREHMPIARQHGWSALRFWPLQIGAWAALAASLLPPGLRHRLAQWVRRARYPADMAQRL